MDGRRGTGNGGYVSHRDTGDGGGRASLPCTEGNIFIRLLFCVVRVFRGSLLSSEQLLPQSPGLYSIAETTKPTARSFILCGFSRSARLPSTSTAFTDTPYKKWQPSSRQWISYSFQGWVQEEAHKEPHNPSPIPAKGFRTSKAVNYFVPQQGASAKA